MVNGGVPNSPSSLVSPKSGEAALPDRLARGLWFLLAEGAAVDLGGGLAPLAPLGLGVGLGRCRTVVAIGL